MYTRRKREISHASIAYFMEIIIHFGFEKRLRVFHAVLEKILLSLAADLTAVAQTPNTVAALLWVP